MNQTENCGRRIMEANDARMARFWKNHSMHLHRQTQSLTSLLSFLRLQAPFPLLDSWSAAPDLLLHIANLIATVKPRVIVECGSGVSTLVMARTAELVSPGSRVVSIEHDPEFVQRTRVLIGLHKLTDIADIVHAPLTELELDGRATEWYLNEPFQDLREIDLLLVDGPPGSVGADVRYPAVPLLHDRLSRAAVVLLDDTARADEAAVADRWAAGYLSGFRRSDIALLRGLTQFERRAAGT